ncbi:MAG: KEOPS complex subunit Pcc1 [Candidatus Bathyarchaeia archaeon]
MKATIRLNYADAKLALAVADAVGPDNYVSPPGLTVQTQLDGASVVTEICLKGKLSTLLSTIDDLLESASTAEKTLRTVRKES